MRIAVLVKEVPAASSRRELDPATLRLRRDGDAELDPGDEHALEEALRLVEAAGDGEVVAVSMAPGQAARTLKRCLAMGAHRAVLVSDDAAAGSDVVATATVLAAALGREGPDLVLLGQQASDSDGGLLWAAVAERLRLPALSRASELQLPDGAAGSLRAWRGTDSGRQQVEVPLPAVVAVAREANEPRIVSLKGSIAARGKPLELLSLADVGLDAGAAGLSGSRTVALATEPTRPTRARERVDGTDAEAAAAQIAAFLAARGLA